MNRFFKVKLATLNHIRGVVINELNQPNGQADEPWKEGGDFNDGTFGYIALGSHHTGGEFFGPLLEQFITLPDVEEITETAYVEARPQE